MKKVEFGFNNSYNPNSSWEGIGIKKGLMLCDADYYGSIKFENNSYMVAKVVEDEYQRFPHLLGNFIVRPAIADIYADGSGSIYLDQEETQVTKQLEIYLNNLQYRDKISNIDDIINIFNNVDRADRSFEFLTSGEKVVTTSIIHEVFERKNSALKKCRMSFSDMQEKLMGLENSHIR